MIPTVSYREIKKSTYDKREGNKTPSLLIYYFLKGAIVIEYFDLQKAAHYIPNMNQVQLQYQGEDNERVHYVLWSGGCDSTLLLYELIEAYGADRVVAVSYRYPWLIASKAETEALYRETFIAKMKLRGHIVRHSHFDVNVKTCSGDGLMNGGGGFPQAIGWLYSIPMYTHGPSYVYHGTIKDDDLCSVLHEYGQIFENTAKVLQRKISLRLPYLYLTKANIIEKLIHYGLYEETWYCENPPGANKQCHECMPCKTHLTGLIALQQLTTDELVRLTAEKEIMRLQELREKKNQILSNTKAEFIIDK